VSVAELEGKLVAAEAVLAAIPKGYPFQSDPVRYVRAMINAHRSDLEVAMTALRSFHFVFPDARAFENDEPMLALLGQSSAWVGRMRAALGEIETAARRWLRSDEVLARVKANPANKRFTWAGHQIQYLADGGWLIDEKSFLNVAAREPQIDANRARAPFLMFRSRTWGILDVDGPNWSFVGVPGEPQFIIDQAIVALTPDGIRLELPDRVSPHLLRYGDIRWNSAADRWMPDERIH
jgi:hypothetical protein